MPDLNESRYPGTADMPEMGMPDSQKSTVQSNPVIGALQTIQTWVASMEQQNAPGIQEFKQKFMELLQTASNMGGASGGSAPQGSGGNTATMTPQQSSNGVGMPQSRNMAGSPTAKPMV